VQRREAGGAKRRSGQALLQIIGDPTEGHGGGRRKSATARRTGKGLPRVQEIPLIWTERHDDDPQRRAAQAGRRAGFAYPPVIAS